MAMMEQQAAGLSGRHSHLHQPRRDARRRAGRAAVEAIEPRLLMSVGTLAPLAAFDSTTGVTPNALVMDSGGNIFGTTQNGGTGNLGTIFEIAAGASTINVLASFDSTTGGDPLGSLTMDSQGNLFGVTSTGGANNGGTIFEVAKADPSTINVLASFDSTSGSQPAGGLTLDKHGNLYGMTTSGAANNFGTVYELAAGATTITPLVAIDSSAFWPVGSPVIDSDGNVFGVMTRGGADNAGTVFEVVSGSGVMTTVASMDWSTTGQGFAGGLIQDSHGNLYGATQHGGANNYGTIFKIAAADHSLNVLASLDFGSGAIPSGTMFLDSQGNLFGTTNYNGGNLDGTIFELPSGATSVVAIASFDSSTGRTGFSSLFGEPGPDGNLVADSQGNLFGPAAIGAANNGGAIFELPGAAASVVATRVVVTQQPADTTANSTNTITVKMEDAQGNVDTSINGSVTVSMVGGPAGASLGGTTTVTAVNGVATFTGLSYHRAGNYTLRVAEGNLTSAISDHFTVIAGAASQLVFARQPVDSLAGTALPPVTVQVQDAYGNLVTADSSHVSISIATPLGTILTGHTMVAASGGVSTFSDLAITLTGHYTLRATDGALTPKVSISFEVTPATAAKLVILQQPANITTANVISTLVVAVEDAYGNVVTGDNSTISISLANTISAALAGTLTVPAVNGVATFDHLSITGLGSHTLIATDADLISTESTAVAVPQVAGKRLEPIAINLATLPHKKNQLFHARLISGPAGTRLDGVTAVHARHDQVKFKNLRFRKAGSYTFQISDKHGAVMTETVLVIPAQANHLKFAQQPTLSGGTLSTSVEVVDRFGNVVVDNNADITLKLGNHARSDVQLQGTVTTAAVNGVATFNNLTVNTPGSYHLIAEADHDQPVRSMVVRIA